MDKEMSNALRAPFDPAYVGQLPRGTCVACREDRSKVCPKHTKVECKVCGNYMSSAHVHLDYVGHADVTNRLLLVDPEWTWEPVAFDEAGQPKFTLSPDKQYAMWIRLTVGGVTRLGVGLVSDKSEDILKQLISDAIRNAAMRFGVALDLWSKAERLESAPIVDGEPSVNSVGDVSHQRTEGVTSAVNNIVDIAPAGYGQPSPPSHSSGEAEPFPEYHGEYHGEDEWDDEFSDVGPVQDRGVETAGNHHPSETVPVQTVSATKPGGAGALLSDAQKGAIKRLMDAAGMPMESRGAYVSTTAGREVGRLDELNRKEASKVLKRLVDDKENGSRASVA